MSDIEKLETQPRRSQIGNPAPLYVAFHWHGYWRLYLKTHWPYSALFAFASTTLVLSLYNVHARHITVSNVAVSMTLFHGGLAQFVAGMWEFVAGNTFNATGEYRRNSPIIGSWLFRVGGFMALLSNCCHGG